jgi:hypothetical protein
MWEAFSVINNITQQITVWSEEIEGF